jgi:cytochrome b pre-mRNA-processing protein 3
MGFFGRIFGARRQRERLAPLYRAIVGAARDRGWYEAGGVPDSVDGRFDMIAAILSLVLIRIEEGADKEAPALLAETFIDDMEASLREIGVGDVVVGKHLGRMVGAVGGRLTAFRSAFAGSTGLVEPVKRNIFHEKPPSPEALAYVTGRLEAFHAALSAIPAEALIGGRLPSL